MWAVPAHTPTCTRRPPAFPLPTPAAAAERDELRGAIGELLSRLEEANGLLSQADSRVSGTEEATAAVAAERQRAEEEAAAAREEAAALRDEVADLQFKCGLLQQLSDLTLKQNDERTATLRALLDSESALRGGEGSDGAGADGSDSESDEGL